MKWFGRIFFIVMISLLFAACSKGGYSTTAGDPNHIVDFSDTTFPVIEITTPTSGQEFRSGNAINITGKITDNSLYQGTITITEEGLNFSIKDQVYEIHGLSSYNYSLSYTPSVTKVTNYIISVAFEDHGFNKSSKSVKVKVSP